MAIPGPGTAISINTIVAEFGGTAPHSISEYYRGGGLVPQNPANAAIPISGTIALGNFYGAINKTAYTLTIAADTQNYDVYTNRGPLYVAGSDITVQINPGVTVGSATTPGYALLVPSAFSPTDTITIVNNGAIRGTGGTGGVGGTANPGGTNPGSPGLTGGNAIYVNRPTTITNNNTVAGGGGGGGGGSGRAYAQPAPKGTRFFRLGGGGGGGGAGASGGTGGAGGVGESGTGASGSTGGATTGGAGGTGAASGAGSGNTGGVGGGAGASGTPSAPASGGAAGNYIVGNAFVTWPATGTRQGGVA